MTNMRLFAIIVTFIVSIVAPEILEVVESQIATSCPTAVNLDAKTNVWKEYTLHANSFWRNQVLAAADAINATDTSLKERAVRFANAGNFLWMYVKWFLHTALSSYNWTAKVRKTSARSKKLSKMYPVITFLASFSPALYARIAPILRLEQTGSINCISSNVGPFSSAVG